MDIQKFIKKTQKKLGKIREELDLKESSEIINELETLLLQLGATAQVKGSSKLLPSEIAELIKSTPLIDINGAECKVEDIQVSGNSISVWYCDPGNWENDEEEDCEEEVLTDASISVIKSFLKNLSPQIQWIGVESYHLADVKINVSVS